MGFLNWLTTSDSAGRAAGGDDLLDRCLAGDDSAYAALYRRHAAMIYRLTYSILGNQEDAEEVLQDAFVYAFRALPQYDPRKAAFKTWLYRIAVSRCHNKRRRKWLPTAPLSQMADDGADLADRHGVAPDEAVAVGEAETAVWQALEALSPKLRAVAVLRYYDGLTYEEIGRILAIPAKTAESRMRLAHAALRQQLAGHG